jgi:hypothetical protein
LIIAKPNKTKREKTAFVKINRHALTIGPARLKQNSGVLLFAAIKGWRDQKVELEFIAVTPKVALNFI